MTNDQLEKIYVANLAQSRATALRAIFQMGYMMGAGNTPGAGMIDNCAAQTFPTVTPTMIKFWGDHEGSR